MRFPRLRIRTSLLIGGLFCMAFAGCGTLSALRPLPPEEEQTARETCFLPFPRAVFRAVHRIDFTFFGGRHVSFLGVTIGDPNQERIRAVLLSAEGITVFDAVYRQGTIRIGRSLLPGDSAAFAQGLFDDIRLIFFRPEIAGATIGMRSDLEQACRFPFSDGLQEISRHEKEDVWEATRYDKKFHKIKVLHLQGPITHGFAKTAVLQSFRKPFYSLELELLEEESLSASEDFFSF